MPLRQEIIDRAVDHHDMVARAPECAQVEYEIDGHAYPVLWAVWKDDASPDGVGIRLVKGWDKVFDAAAEWGAVVVDGEIDACEVQEMDGDGEATLARDHWPAGAVTT